MSDEYNAGEIVSVVMPSYNSERFIGTAIESVIAQTFGNWELIIVDDASRDNTVPIIQKYAADEGRLKYFVSETNRGAASTRNIGIDKAIGHYIAFLDSDDVWHCSKLGRQVNFMRTNGLALSYTSFQKIDAEGNKQNSIREVPLEVSYESMLKNCAFACPTAMYDRKMVGPVRMPNIVLRQDYGFWLRILKCGHRVAGINEPLTFCRFGHTSLSSNKLRAAWYQWQCYRKVENLPFFSSLYYFMYYAYHGILKYVVRSAA